MGVYCQRSTGADSWHRPQVIVGPVDCICGALGEVEERKGLVTCGPVAEADGTMDGECLQLEAG